MNFLLNTRTDWNEPPRARHQLARGLAKNHHVIFVAINQIGKPSLNIETPEKNITVISPSWWIHGKVNMRLPIINELYQKWLYIELMKNYAEYNVINFDLTAVGLNKYFNNYMYFCIDNFISTKRSKSFLVSHYWTNKQKKVIHNALFCTGVSKYLHNFLLKYNKNSHLLLTGASFVNQENSNFKVVGKDEKINVVYVGWLTKLNIEWVIAISKKNNYNIYLIGPGLNNSLDSLNNIKNVIMPGELVGDDLKKIMMEANISIAPYVHDRDTEETYTMPNKFWLYLSFGKPIVTCKINNLADLPEKFVYQSKSSDEFIANIDKAVSDDSHDLFRERIHFIRQNTWDIRVDELLALNRKYAAS